jgi:hypothetical protein
LIKKGKIILFITEILFAVKTFHSYIVIALIADELNIVGCFAVSRMCVMLVIDLCQKK